MQSLSLHPEAAEAKYLVSPKRLLDESPWLQFASECQRFDSHHASISSRFGQVAQVNEGLKHAPFAAPPQFQCIRNISAADVWQPDIEEGPRYGDLAHVG